MSVFEGKVVPVLLLIKKPRDRPRMNSETASIYGAYFLSIGFIFNLMERIVKWSCLLL